MATLMQTAALTVLHSHCSASLHQNASMAMVSSRGVLGKGMGKLSQSSAVSFGSGRRMAGTCNSSMSFNNGLPVDQPFSENDEDYIDSTVLEALEVKSGPEGFIIKMRDGRFLKCEHNRPESGHLPEYGPQPAIVLQMNNGSKLLLPIIVLELPCTMLIDAVRNVPAIRPTVYHVMKEMIDVMGYEPKMVRITRRVHEAYYARVYLAKVGDESGEVVSLDLRPSDAINLAVRCKVPIQVNKWLAEGDGVHVVAEPAKLPPRALRSTSSSLLTMTNLDRPDSTPCAAAEEFILVRNMMIAAVEERYSDAAKLRDELRQLRDKKKRSRQFRQL
jgi:bifunctional DNase/RNase